MSCCDKIENKLLSLLKEKNITFTSAESCTGGMIGAVFTCLPGASRVYHGSVVSYSNEVKMNVIGVKSETLERYTAVSEETAFEMAYGVRRLIGADIAVSVTGYAGPSAGEDGKPVGYVCFGISTEKKTETILRQFGESKTREEIRLLAVEEAFKLVYEAALEF